MKLVPRKNTAPPVAEVLDEPVAVAAAKGRPTPKRRESSLQRGPVTAPKTRKEALARQRQQAKEVRTARKTPTTSMTAQQRRAAMRSGDPAALPRRDQGQTRKLARDYVDSHRMASNYLLLLFPLLIAGNFVARFLQLVVIAAFLALVLEWNITGRKIRKIAVERFGKADGSAMSIGFYAGSRAYLPRRWRLPAAQVALGDEI